jgi:hypothetical protein
MRFFWLISALNSSAMTCKNQHLLWLKTEYLSNQCLNQIPWSAGQSCMIQG